jgi:hypothetical protein
MATLEEVALQLESLSADSLEELALFMRYLRWKERPAQGEVSGLPWDYDFVEHFRKASVTSDRDPAGMEVQVGEASCGSDWRMAMWQHPPVEGSSSVEYQVAIPPNVRGLRLRLATGIRDGSDLAAGNVVAFRVFVNDWRIWSDTQHARTWKAHEIIMPTIPGDVVRVRFVTDGLGNHQWAWAAWGEPRLFGEIID